MKPISKFEHDAEHPFVVKVAGHKITDLGTKFLVRAGAGQLEIALMEGRARLDTADAWNSAAFRSPIAR